MPLEVIGAGYPRTGTMSLKLALEQLGFGPTHHMIEIFDHPDQAALWARAFSEDGIDWEDVLAGYNSCCDAPSCFVYKELAARYPRAKVILTIRSAESWWESAQATVMSQANRDGLSDNPAGAKILPMFMAMRSYMTKQGRDWVNPEQPDRATAMAAFNAHNEEVRRLIDPDRLLVFEPRQGWEPLCRFLGVPAPTTPYPRVNTREEFHHVAAASRAGGRKPASA